MNRTEKNNKDSAIKCKDIKHKQLLSSKDQTNKLNTNSNLTQHFTHKYSQISGQPCYNLTSNHSHKTIQNQSESNREYLWITEKGRQLFQTKNSWKNHIGPGKYPSFSPTERHQSNWTKSKRFNYQQTEVATSVGPGLYQTGINDKMKQRVAASSAFKSKKTKSYLADRISELHKNQQPIVNPEVQFELIETQVYFENENHYQKNQTKNKIKASPVFISKCQRLPTIITSNVGPGSYIIQQPKNKSPRIIKRIVTEPQNYVSKVNLVKKKQSQVQITFEAEKYTKVDEQLQTKRKAVLGVIMKDKRFRQICSKYPGPGNYQVIKNIAKTQKSINSPPSYQKLKEADRLIGSVVRKVISRNRQNIKSQSQVNVFKLFKHFQKGKDLFEELQKQG